MDENSSFRRTMFLKPDALEAALVEELRKLGTEPITRARIALHLGVKPNTYWRQTCGEEKLSRRGRPAKTPTKDRRRQTASPEFQAAVYDHFGQERFFEFFEACNVELVAAA